VQVSFCKGCDTTEHGQGGGVQQVLCSRVLHPAAVLTAGLMMPQCSTCQQTPSGCLLALLTHGVLIVGALAHVYELPCTAMYGHI
jgi:hypothetical protein